MNSPMLPFDVTFKPTPIPKIQSTGIYVIAGGPCSGKTSLVKALANEGLKTIPETAEQWINEGNKAGIPVEEQRKDPIEWQMDLLQKDFALFDKLADTEGLVITDTSFIETSVFSSRAGIEMGPGVQSWLLSKRYRSVFLLEPIKK